MIETTQISERGKQIKVPSLTVGDNSIVVTGKFLKVARFRSEDYVQGNWLGDLNQLVEQVKASTLGADVFSFAQRIPDTVAQFNFPVYLDILDQQHARLPRRKRTGRQSHLVDIRLLANGQRYREPER